MFFLLVGMALFEGLADSGQDLIAKGQTAQLFRELLGQHFLANVSVAAFPFEAGAMIVDVFLLLDFADERAAALAALDQT